MLLSVIVGWYGSDRRGTGRGEGMRARRNVDDAAGYHLAYAAAASIEDVEFVRIGVLEVDV